VDAHVIDYYAAPGPLTELDPDQVAMIRKLERDPEGLCRVAQGILISRSTPSARDCPPTA
jgi:hypothetical protein